MFRKVASAKQLQDGSPVQLEVEGQKILLISNDAGLFAVENCCPHQSRTLETATVSGKSLRCIYHGVELDISNGEITRDAGYIGLEPIRVYPVAEKEGDILIDLQEDE